MLYLVVALDHDNSILYITDVFQDKQFIYATTLKGHKSIFMIIIDDDDDKYTEKLRIGNM